MEHSTDVTIIGSGIIGANISFELNKKGYKTINVDKLPASGYGSTSNSCACIRFSYSSWEGVAMAYEGAHYWKNWNDYIGTLDPRGMAQFFQTGVVFLRDKSSHFGKVKKLYDEVGVTYEIWDAEIIIKTFPSINLDSYWPVRRPEDPLFNQKSGKKIIEAIWNPDGGYINDPQLATHNLQVASEAKGGKFVFNREVVRILKNKDRVSGVELDDGTRINSPIVVNVAGPHSKIINKMAGVIEGMNVGTRALRHEVHHVPAPKGFNFEKNGKIMNDGDVGCYYRPAPGNAILVGSEDPECDQRQWIDDPDEFNRDVTEIQWNAQVMRLAKRFEQIGIPNRTKGVVDLYDVSDDWIPIYDKSDLEGFYMAIGTSGNQFKNASIAACMMTELIDNCENGVDHDQHPIQFKAAYTKKKLNIGFYSRKRELNKNSSFSVRG